MSKTPAYFGNFPFTPSEKKPMLINRETMKMFIYTPEAPHTSDLNWLLVSTDKMTVGKYQLAPGSHFDPPDIHAGDEVYYVIRGSITMLNVATGQVVELTKGESILLPMGCVHKAYNFTNDDALILFVIAPRIWDESGPPDAYTEPMKLYKYER
jgi:mannose-6-phosphate isomerase-like protein (cupin superfamily)